MSENLNIAVVSPTVNFVFEVANEQRRSALPFSFGSLMLALQLIKLFLHQNGRTSAFVG